MVSKPLTLFVLSVTVIISLFESGAEHQPASLPELSFHSRLQGPTAQLLGNAAVVGMASAATTLTSSEIAKEVCVTAGLMLLSAWLVRQVLAQRRQVVSLAGQPTKGACLSASSPHKGLATSSRCGLEALLTYPWRFCRWYMQRRRLYLHAAVTRLEGILPSLCGSSRPLDAHLRRPCEPRSHNLHDFHEALPKDFLMPLEVAACRSPPEVSTSLQRLLADRWWELEDPHLLESVPEDERLVLDDAVLEDDNTVLDDPWSMEVLPDLPNEQTSDTCF